MDKRTAKAVEAMRAAGGLATPRDIAREWNVREATISDRIKRGDFPEPVFKAGRVRLYLRSQVEPYRR